MTQLNGKQGVFLAHEKKVVKFADQQTEQYNALMAADANSFPETPVRALDKRVVSLVQQWKVCRPLQCDIVVLWFTPLRCSTLSCACRGDVSAVVRRASVVTNAVVCSRLP